MDQVNPSRRKPSQAKGGQPCAGTQEAQSQSQSQSQPDAPSQGLEAVSFEQAMAELETLVAKLEGGDLPLAEALAAYQRGSKLAGHAQSLLDHVQSQIEVIESGQARSIDRASLISQIKE